MEDQIRQIKTGDDAISFFARNGSSTRLKFIYWNRREPANAWDFAPYELVAINEYQVLWEQAALKSEEELKEDSKMSAGWSDVMTIGKDSNFAETIKKVDTSKLVNAEYFTISSSGIVHAQPGQPSEYLSIPEWISESLNYNVVSSMNFFKYFCHRKLFNSWKKNTRYDVYCEKRKQLASKLFMAKPLFAPDLAKCMQSSYDVASVKVSSV